LESGFFHRRNSRMFVWARQIMLQVRCVTLLQISLVSPMPCRLCLTNLEEEPRRMYEAPATNKPQMPNGACVPFAAAKLGRGLRCRHEVLWRMRQAVLVRCQHPLPRLGCAEELSLCECALDMSESFITSSDFHPRAFSD
jgi:hypothetical protein